MKLSRSAGSGKCVFMVDGRSNSVRSWGRVEINFDSIERLKYRKDHTFLHTNLRRTRLWLLLGSSVLAFLHAPYLVVRGSATDLSRENTLP